MRALVISAQVSAAIGRAIAAARSCPLTLDDVKALDVGKVGNLSLEDRRGKRPQSEFVEIPFGFRAAISFEMQPGGLSRHLSVSVDTPGQLPGAEAFAMIARAFGMPFDQHVPVGLLWLEEFDPGHKAVNYVLPETLSEDPK